MKIWCIIYYLTAAAFAELLETNMQTAAKSCWLKSGEHGALCQSAFENVTHDLLSSHSVLQLQKGPLIRSRRLPEEIFKAGQLVARQMDDDGLFVRLSLKEMRSSGQQNGSVGSEGARVSEERDIGLQLLLQQPGEKHRGTKYVL